MDAEREMERKDKQPCQNTLTRLSSFAEIKHPSHGSYQSEVSTVDKYRNLHVNTF